MVQFSTDQADNSKADQTLDSYDSGILPETSSASFTTMHPMFDSSHNDSLSEIIPPKHDNQLAGVGSSPGNSSRREDTSDIPTDSSKHPSMTPIVADKIPPPMPAVDVIQFPRSPGVRLFLTFAVELILPCPALSKT